LYRKLNTPLRFYAELYMDRYFVEQRESTSQVRKVVSQWRSELAVLDRDIKAITNFKIMPYRGDLTACLKQSRV